MAANAEIPIAYGFKPNKNNYVKLIGIMRRKSAHLNQVLQLRLKILDFSILCYCIKSYSIRLKVSIGYHIHLRLQDIKIRRTSSIFEKEHLFGLRCNQIYSIRLTFDLRYSNLFALSITASAIAIFRSIYWWLAFRVFAAWNVCAISSVTPEFPIWNWSWL